MSQASGGRASLLRQHSPPGLQGRPWRGSHAQLLPLRVCRSWPRMGVAHSALHGSTSAEPLPTARRTRPLRIERAGDLTDQLLRDYLSGWASQYNEYDYYVPPEAIHGTLPEELHGGTLFLIGPGLTEVYGTSVRHPSDADGMVCSLAFGDGGRVFFRNRYVRTPFFVAEQALRRRITRGLHDRGAPAVSGEPSQQQRSEQPQRQRSSEATAPKQRSEIRTRNSRPRSHREDPLGEDTDEGDGGNNRGAAAAALSAASGAQPTMTLRLDPLALLGLPPLPPLSSLFNPLDTSFRAPANANIVYWGGRLLAFSEGGSLPYELHKLSLETVGPFDAGGTMSDLGRLVAGYKIAPAPPAAASEAPPPAPLNRYSVPSAAGRAGTAGTSTGSCSSARAILGTATGLGSPSAREPLPKQAQVLVLLGCAQSGPDTLLRWVELGEDGRPCAHPTSYRLPGASAAGVRDFWVTERHYVVVQAPLDFNPQRFLTRATLGAASFAECFDWDGSRPSRIHLVPRPHATATAASGSRGSSGRSAASGAPNRSSNGQQERDSKGQVLVWPPEGPESVVLECPPLLPARALGCYILDGPSGEGEGGGSVLVLDALCQQGMHGLTGGTIDSLDPEEHRLQPKPELTRITVDLSARTVTARVLSQRTAVAATIASMQPVVGAPAAVPAAVPPLASLLRLNDSGFGSSLFSAAYQSIFVAASATDGDGTGWAPAQVLMRLAVPPEHTGAPASLLGANSRTCKEEAHRMEAKPGIANAGVGCVPTDPLVRRRGIAAEVWSPGDRVFVGPPVFVPRRQASTATSAPAADVPTVTPASGFTPPGTAAAGSGSSNKGPAGGGGDGSVAASPSTSESPLPPLESELLAAAHEAAAAAAARRRELETAGWLLVMLHDAETQQAELCVLDAEDLARGPVAVVRLPHHVPHVRAAHWVHSYCGPGLAAPPGWVPRKASSG